MVVEVLALVVRAFDLARYGSAAQERGRDEREAWGREYAMGAGVSYVLRVIPPLRLEMRLYCKEDGRLLSPFLAL